MTNANENFSSKFYGVLPAVSFGINLVWEISQMSFFEGKPGGSTLENLFFCAVASVIDALTTAAVFRLLVKTLQKIDWRFYLAAAFLGAVCAVIFEAAAGAFGFWSYDEKMPIIPFLNTGLLPFVQLTILIPLAIWLALKLKKN